MKLLLSLIMVLVMTTGCATFMNPDGSSKVSPYQVGRTTATLYVLGEESLKPDQKKTIKTVYMVFEASILAVNADDIHSFKGILKSEVVKALKNEDAKYRILASQLIDFYWDKLIKEVDIDNLTRPQAISVLSEFYRGTKDALAEYAPIRTID
jgi:hypothetical protein